MLIGEIEEAKELPSLESLYQAEYPSRPEGYNWPRSYEQYKDQVGTLQDDMDEAFGDIEDMKDIIKELQKDIKDLEKRKRDK
jgi:predicted  nucleic acid-binding Zn-ribbon protein